MSVEKLRPTILVVDDEHTITGTLKLILEKHGFVASVAHSGEEAVHLARELTPQYVVADIVMGAMSGIDAAIEIRKLCPECTIVLMSGNASTDDLLIEARGLGHHFDVLAKPFHPTELLAVFGEA